MSPRQLVLGVLLASSVSTLGAWRWLAAAAPPPEGQLDLNGYSLLFEEDFDKPLDVSPWGPRSRWIAHTPWNGDFGDAAFADPSPGFPFTVANGVLRIEARKDPAFLKADGKRAWRSGLLASNDAKGNGFSAQYGYFEISARLPTGVGVWPAFWLASTRSKPSSGEDSSIEIDVFEYYGAPAKYQEVVHVWKPGPHHETGQTVSTQPGDVYRAFHRYGVLVTPTVLKFYFDGAQVWSVPTPKEHKKPLMVLLNLALGSGFPIDDVPSPTFMYVDYVRVWAPPR